MYIIFLVRILDIPWTLPTVPPSGWQTHFKQLNRIEFERRFALRINIIYIYLAFSLHFPTESLTKQEIHAWGSVSTFVWSRTILDGLKGNTLAGSSRLPRHLPKWNKLRYCDVDHFHVYPKLLCVLNDRYETFKIQNIYCIELFISIDKHYIKDKVLKLRNYQKAYRLYLCSGWAI